MACSSKPLTRAGPGGEAASPAASSDPARATVSEEEEELGRLDRAAEQLVGVVRRGAGDRQLGELGRRVDAAAGTGVLRSHVEGGRDRGTRLGGAEGRVPGMLLGVGDDRGEPLVHVTTRFRRQAGVRDRRHQRVGEADPLVVDLEHARPDRLGEAACGLPPGLRRRR